MIHCQRCLSLFRINCRMKLRPKITVVILIIFIICDISHAYKDEDDDNSSNDALNVSSKKKNNSSLVKKKITGIFVPPQTGEYKFYSSCGESCDVYLSANEKAVDRSKIISQTQRTESNIFERYPDQVSHLIYLKKGKKYLMEAKTKVGQTAERSHISVGVILPDDTKLFPIMKPVIRNVIVTNTPVLTKSKLQETTGTSRGTVAHTKMSPTSRKSVQILSSVHKTLKSKLGSMKRLQNKLDQVSTFIKDLEKTKDEEKMFDVNFEDVMKTLEDSLKKYSPGKLSLRAAINQSENSKPKHNDDTSHHKKEKLKITKSEEVTGNSRSFEDNDEIRTENFLKFSKHSDKNKQPITELLDALQKSLDTDSRKKKRSKYYHTKFEKLMDQINSLKEEAHQDENSKKRSKKIKTSKNKKKVPTVSLDEDLGSDNYEGSGSGEESFNYFAHRHYSKSKKDRDATKKYNNDVFSTLKGNSRSDNHIFKKPEQGFYRSEEDDKKENLDDEIESTSSVFVEDNPVQVEENYKHYPAQGNGAKRNSKYKYIRKSDKARMEMKETNRENNALRDGDNSSNENEDSKLTYPIPNLEGESDSKEPMKSNYIKKEKSFFGETTPFRSGTDISIYKSFDKEKGGDFHNLGVLSADESLYRLRPDSVSDNSVKEVESSSLSRLSDRSSDENTPIQKAFMEANAVSRSKGNLDKPIVMHAPMVYQDPSTSSPKKILNYTIANQDVKSLENALFNAFQERLAGGEKQLSEESSITDTANKVPIESNEGRAYTLNNVQKVLENALLTKLTGEAAGSNHIKNNFIKQGDNDNHENLKVPSLEISFEKNSEGSNAGDMSAVNIENVKTPTVFSYLHAMNDNSAASTVKLFEKNLKQESEQVTGKKSEENFAAMPIFYEDNHNQQVLSANSYTKLRNDNNNKDYSQDKITSQVSAQSNNDQNVNAHGESLPHEYNSYIAGSIPVQTFHAIADNKIEGLTKAEPSALVGSLNTPQREPTNTIFQPVVDDLIPSISQATDHQLFIKISDLIKEINDIKMQIVAMKRNKVVGSYKKSLIQKLNTKTKLLSDLQSKRNMINKPSRKRTSILQPKS